MVNDGDYSYKLFQAYKDYSNRVIRHPEILTVHRHYGTIQKCIDSDRRGDRGDNIKILKANL